jgi:hypothetical protein
MEGQDNPPIFRRSIDGGTTESIGFSGAFVLLQDDANIYSASVTVRQISKSSGQSITLVGSTPPQMYSLAVGADRVYFVEAGRRDILSVPVGGGTVEAVVTRNGDPGPQIAADETRVYWFNPGGASIWAAPHAGGAVTKVADTGGPPDKIAVYDGALYWTIPPPVSGKACKGRSDGWPSLQTCPTTGGPVRTLASGYPSTRGFSTNGLAFDDTSVYWLTGDDGCTPSVRNKVMRSAR